MDEGTQLRGRLAQLPDDELLDIVEGRDLGYREEALLVAQEVLRSRGVPFTPVPFQQLDRVAAALHAAADEADDVRQQRKLGRNLLLIGLGIFVLPFFGLQLSLASSFGVEAFLLGGVSLAAGAYVLSRADERAKINQPPPVSGEYNPGASTPQPRKSVAAGFIRVGVFILGVYLLLALASWFMGDAWR